MGGNLMWSKRNLRLEKEIRRDIARRNSSRAEIATKWSKAKNKEQLNKKLLNFLYPERKHSMQEIANLLHCSLHKVAYWINKHEIKVRSKSEAAYLKHHPLGDPFEFHWPKTIQEAKLFGLGLGLYWGEGNKANENSIRLGNTDPRLIKSFVRFLERIYGVGKNNLRFGLQIFSDINPKKALQFWIKKLQLKESQFQKVIITPSRGIGTYKKKSKYGVLTVQFHNKKLRDVLMKEIENLE